VGKKITAVQKKFMSIQDRIENLPESVRLVAFPHPFSYEISGDDRMIFVSKYISNSFVISRVDEIVRDLSKASPEDIEDLKMAQKILAPIQIFNKEELKKSNPEIYMQVYGS
jgi:hypothetical protein